MSKARKVRVNISLAVETLRRIDQQAELAGVNRSDWIARTATRTDTGARQKNSLRRRLDALESQLGKLRDEINNS